jgi:hypothetical protein
MKDRQLNTRFFGALALCFIIMFLLCAPAEARPLLPNPNPPGNLITVDTNTDTTGDFENQGWVVINYSIELNNLAPYVITNSSSPPTYTGYFKILGYLNNYGDINSSGDIDNKGIIDNKPGGTIDNYGDINNDGTISNWLDGTIDNDGTINNQLGGIIDSDGTINNLTDGYIINSDRIYNWRTIYNDGAISNKSGGDIRNLSGVINNRDTGTIDNYSTIHNASGTINNKGIIDNKLGGTIENYGTINNKLGGTIKNEGTINNAFGTINNKGIISNSDTFNNSSGTFNNYGIYQGTGTFIGTLDTGSGTVAPGNSAGTMNVEGNYILDGTGTLEIEIGGFAPGLGLSDLLDITGTADLSGGTINFLFIDGYDIASEILPGESLVIEFLHAVGGITSFGSTINYSLLGGPSGFEYNVYQASNVLYFQAKHNINVVPAPGAVLLCGIGVGIVGWLRIRKTI